MHIMENGKWYQQNSKGGLFSNKQTVSYLFYNKQTGPYLFNNKQTGPKVTANVQTEYSTVEYSNGWVPQEKIFGGK